MSEIICMAFVILVLLLWGICSVRAVCAFVSERRDQKERIKKIEAEEPKSLDFISVEARVFDKKIEKHYLGRGRGFEYRFFITFLTHADDNFEYQVSEDVFAHIDAQQKGTLMTVNGHFFDFQADKE